MTQAIDIAKQYFHYSNLSDMTAIASLLAENSTYYSNNLGFFIGKEAIIEMQQIFHGQYQKLFWQITQIAEEKTDVAAVEFTFEGVLLDGHKQNRIGKEHILICDGLIQHIAVGL